HNATVHLYELDEPNLATYSPTKIGLIASAREMVEQLQRVDFDFQTEAVSDSPLPTDLVRVSGSTMNTVKDRILIEATSSGTSVLLLPLQYSHCLELRDLQQDERMPKPNLVRLNVMQAGLVFTGSAKVEIRFANGAFRNQFGRLEDYQDMKKM